jgi:hypothetical protein
MPADTHVAAPPSDGLGDGTQTTPTAITLDPSTLTLHQAVDYRRDLITAIWHPGTDYDEESAQGQVDHDAYKAQLVLVDNRIAALGGT